MRSARRKWRIVLVWRKVANRSANIHTESASRAKARWRAPPAVGVLEGAAKEEAAPRRERRRGASRSVSSCTEFRRVLSRDARPGVSSLRTADHAPSSAALAAKSRL